MTDKPDQDVQPNTDGREGGAPRAAQPTFEDVMRGAAAAPLRKAVVVQRARPIPQQANVQPSFEDILKSVAVSPEAVAKASGAATIASASEAPPVQKPRPRREKEPRKAPVVVRRPALPRPGEPAPEAAAAAPQEELAPQAEPASPRERRPEGPIGESVFAQPGIDEGKDFGALLEEEGSRPRPERLRPGAKVAARVAHLGAEVAFLDLGGKGEGIIDLRELRDAQGELLVHPGEELQGYVLSLGEGTVVVTRAVPKGAGREALQQALEARLPVEGTVTAVNKGGLEVDLGGARAFCPASQIDLRFVDDTAAFVGQKLKFLVQEIRGGNAILSRRAILEEERKAKAEETRQRLEIGAVLEGVVSSVRDFGAFVDLGGIEGLVHVSELSHARVGNAQEVVKAGQKVRVQVLRMEAGAGDKGKPGERIALSMKALEQDPWNAVRPQLAEGGKLQGKVARLQPFGAFVELFPGVDGLVHVSALASKHVSHPREVVQEGETIWVQIESIDDAHKRVALRRITEEDGRAGAPQAPVPRGRADKPQRSEKQPRVGDVVDAKVDRVEAFGVFVTWAQGRGLVPNAELGTPRGSDNQKTTPVGTEFKAQIIDLDDRGRFRLSRTAAERASDRADYEQYQRAHRPAGKGLGTLGDLLKLKLQQRGEE